MTISRVLWRSHGFLGHNYTQWPTCLIAIHAKFVFFQQNTGNGFAVDWLMTWFINVVLDPFIPLLFLQYTQLITHYITHMHTSILEKIWLIGWIGDLDIKKSIIISLIFKVLNSYTILMTPVTKGVYQLLYSDLCQFLIHSAVV